MKNIPIPEGVRREQIFLKMKKLLFFVFAASCMLACTDKNNPSSTSSTITCDPTTQTVFENGGSFTVSISSFTAWSATTNKTWVTISPNSAQGDAFVTIKVASGGKDEATVLFSNGEGTAKLIIYREEEPQSYPNGILPGKFSVSSSKKVQFSQGNLQYQASTKTWRFAHHQYDIIGNNDVAGYGNSYIGNTYSGWIDLFGWGTGNNPVLSSTSESNYRVFVDWGTNAISNGGNQANQWRTLSKDDLDYLFLQRGNAAKLLGLGKVNGRRGLIILPDNWHTPSDVTFTPSTSLGMTRDTYSYSDSGSDHYRDNVYTAEQWNIMESAGAVFLPEAGYRRSTSYEPSYGCYWSSYKRSDGYVMHLEFSNHEIIPHTMAELKSYDGLSVRLVREIE